MDGSKLLIVVDYQKDFVDGALGFAGAELLDLRIAAKICAYHEAGDVVVFTNAGCYAAVISPFQFASLEPPAQLFLTEEGQVLE